MRYNNIYDAFEHIESLFSASYKRRDNWLLKYNHRTYVSEEFLIDNNLPICGRYIQTGDAIDEIL